MSELPRTEIRQMREILLRQAYLLEKVSKLATNTELINISYVMVEIADRLNKMPKW